jgi:predicted nucleic acid-binding protein
MAGAEPIYYWDTCLFLAWIKDEERPSGEMDGVREIIARSKRRDAKLTTSVITMVEVLSCKLPAGLDALFVGLMKRVNKIGVDTKIAGLAHDLRNYYLSRPTEYGGKTFTTPDAIHLATAILYRADEFHTFDTDGSPKSLGLIPFSGDVAGHRLTICKPQAINPGLDLRRPPDGRN